DLPDRVQQFPMASWLQKQRRRGFSWGYVLINESVNRLADRRIVSTGYRLLSIIRSNIITANLGRYPVIIRKPVQRDFQHQLARPRRPAEIFLCRRNTFTRADNAPGNIR